MQRHDVTPDILINNAGIGVGGRFDHVPADRWEQVVQVNLLAPMRLCYLFRAKFPLKLIYSIFSIIGNSYLGIFNIIANTY